MHRHAAGGEDDLDRAVAPVERVAAQEGDHGLERVDVGLAAIGRQSAVPVRVSTTRSSILAITAAASPCPMR